MDVAEIAAAVIVNYSWSTLELCRETNDCILDAAARYPGRLVAFCASPSLSGEASLAELERCARGGARGVGEIRPDLLAADFTDRDVVEPIAALLRKYKLMLLTHASEPVGHLYPGKGAATPDIIYSLITALPDIPVVCAHWGGGLPFYALMPEVRAALANCYFDTAASPFLYRPEIYRRVVDLVGADKVLFGSDYPVMPPRRILDEIDAAGLTAKEKDAILAGNARRLLGI
jgi:predicted TIM-barrel fold metal-dependent hydrolase